MRRVEASGHVPASPAEVFAFLSDPDNLPKWQTGIVLAERITELPDGVGSRARVVRELAGQRIEVELLTTAFEQDRHVGLSSSASGIGVDASLDLEPAGDGTDVRFAMEIKAQNVFMAPLEGMVANAAQPDIADSLERLRAQFARG
jgi:carbon monoxide dehydrogenase subunit G